MIGISLPIQLEPSMIVDKCLLQTADHCCSDYDKRLAMVRQGLSADLEILAENYISVEQGKKD